MNSHSRCGITLPCSVSNSFHAASLREPTLLIRDRGSKLYAVCVSSTFVTVIVLGGPPSRHDPVYPCNLEVALPRAFLACWDNALRDYVAAHGPRLVNMLDKQSSIIRPRRWGSLAAGFDTLRSAARPTMASVRIELGMLWLSGAFSCRFCCLLKH